MKFSGGKVTGSTSNVIAESMHVQCDADGNEYLYLDSIIYHWKDGKAISLVDHETSIKHRLETKKLTTGQQICFLWKDVSTTLEKLSDLKEYQNMQRAMFTVVKGLVHEPDFTVALNMCLSNETKQLPQSEKGNSDTYRETISLITSSIRCWSRLWLWMQRLAIPFGQMQQKRNGESQSGISD